MVRLHFTSYYYIKTVYSYYVLYIHTYISFSLTENNKQRKCNDGPNYVEQRSTKLNTYTIEVCYLSGSCVRCECYEFV